MNTDVKYAHKTSYRINSRIKNIINKTVKDVRKETGQKLSLGKLSRAMWVSLSENAGLRRKFMDSACKAILEETIERQGKKYYVGQKRYGNKQRGAAKSKRMQ
ncbi:MAG: hypothetical protein WCY36_07840 [Candidatus Omnitrophota bacterium]